MVHLLRFLKFKLPFLYVIYYNFTQTKWSLVTVLTSPQYSPMNSFFLQGSLM